MNEVLLWLQDTLGEPTQRDTTTIWLCGCLISELTSLEDNRYLCASENLCDKHRAAFEKDQEEEETCCSTS